MQNGPRHIEDPTTSVVAVIVILTMALIGVLVLVSALASGFKVPVFESGKAPR